ncbi:MAG: threonylcarbamoyl-AMP synthase [Sphingomonadaceae bacterium]|nr:threonylcarbamoyl-AMP synthase [Sphingomonadaceae bacterium]
MARDNHDTRVLPFGDAALADAAALIAAGEPVAVATETVYGLAADATSGEAVARVYAAKGRPGFNPLIVHVLDAAAARRIARFDMTAEALAARFWPGPLTLVLPLRENSGIARLVTAGLPTIAVRVPAHPAMRALLETTNKPLAAPSANASGRISATRARHVLASLGGRIPLILDSGPTAHGIESTIVAVRPNGVAILRLGPIAADDIARATGMTLVEAHAGKVEAPGQLAGHYAPTKPLRLDATEARADEWLIGFGPVRGDATLSVSGDLVEAAARLFDLLHAADASDRARIAITPIASEGIGRAINDRLMRAARNSGG